MGDVEDFRNFMGAVIDQQLVHTQTAAIDEANGAAEAEIVAGGDADDSEGYFVSPTRCQRPRTRTSTSCSASCSGRS